MDSKESLLAHIDDLVFEAKRKNFSHSKFLTAAEKTEIEKYYSKRKDIFLRFEGGFISAERNIAVFSNSADDVLESSSFISAVVFSHREQDIISHRDVLGAVLALGIKRETLGDIMIESGRAILICLSDISKFIIENITAIGRIGVKATLLPIDELPVLQENIKEKSDTVASLRLDAVAASAFNLSRNIIGEYITAGKVQLCHSECLSASKTVKEGDIISIRGKGRAKLLEIGGESKKGRIWIKLGIYE